MKQPITLPLSENATGIRPAETRVFVKNGVSEKCENLEVKIVPHKNLLEISYQKVYLNDKGEKLETTPVLKRVFVTDKGEKGEAELNQNFEIVEGTYTKLEDEDLVVTEWDNQLGEVIISSLVKHIEKLEGYLVE